MAPTADDLELALDNLDRGMAWEGRVTATAMLRRAADELLRLRARCAPAAPPYLPCLWHTEALDDTCPFCLRHEIALLQAQYAALARSCMDAIDAQEARAAAREEI